MQSLLRYLSTTYYTDLISFFTAISAFVIIYKRNEHKELAIFKYYISGYIFVKAFEYIIYLLNIKADLPISKFLFNAHNTIDLVFTIFEFYCFSTFLRGHTHKAIYRITTTTFYLSTAALTILSLVKNDPINYRHQMYNYQAILLFALACSYFIKLFQSNSNNNGAKAAHFWVSSGLLIFIASTLPFSLMSNYIWATSQSDYSHLFSMFFIFYSVLFIMIAKAFSCK